MKSRVDLMENVKLTTVSYRKSDHSRYKWVYLILKIKIYQLGEVDPNLYVFFKQKGNKHLYMQINFYIYINLLKLDESDFCSYNNESC